MYREHIEERNKMVDYFRSQLIGPIGGGEELLDDSPHKRYLMGILFPIAANRDETDDSEDELSSTVALASEFKPSSMALSFAITNDSIIEISLSAGKYLKRTTREWRREQLKHSVIYNTNSNQNIDQTIYDGKGRLVITSRPFAAGRIITVSISNAAKSGEGLKPEDCLYQNAIICKINKGHYQEYPNSDRFKLDEEQKILSLTYRKRVNWAVGHGVAASWDTDKNEQPQIIYTDSMPKHEIKGFSTDLDLAKYPNIAPNVLNIHRIADTKLATNTELLYSFELLIDAYNTWILDLTNEELPSRYSNAKNTILEGLNKTSQRMRLGVNKLRQNDDAMKSFRLANYCMLKQMIHSGKDYGGKVKYRNYGFKRPNYLSSTLHNKFNWRPFQLAFQLLVIESLIEDEDGVFSDSRDIVDLLWFPTGGGKTEAYLAVAAWEMIYRRIRYDNGGGTSIIKRYTLRLLTAQQFQRASTLICSLEDLRKREHPELGNEVFSLGLWVGQGSTPNTFKDAEEKFDYLRNENEPENPFQLQSCPWCGTHIIPPKYSDNDKAYGVRSSSFKFEFYCPSDDCDFHSRLPIQIIDDALYQNPPSLLIGTIDKFARLTWKEGASAFFGQGKKRPPSLIIQDELHLISGPLGTIAGIYEAGFDSIIKSLGVKPKIIAATATIRAADQQVNRLFGRSVNIFPPSGTDESDSFFSKEDTSKAGRLYLGAMPSGHTGQTALVQTGATLLQSPIENNLQNLYEDTWWTLPIYHNSRRELGKTMTMARDDIPARIKVISKSTSDQRDINIVEELSANVKGSKIPDVLAKLSLSTTDKGTIDILPCTNMISVGVDIGRLGMMLINGQPKATAEYIQASSRVGRDKKYPPGIVVTLYSPSKPRDRSHYETFKGYHQALYRYVEPTSITPWAQPAIERALHASLISLVRVSGYLRSNNSAGHFSKKSPEFIKLKDYFIERLNAAMSGLIPSEKQKVFDYLENLINEWDDKAESNEINRYDAGKQFKPLITTYENDKEGAWKTLNSMRNVDTETKLKVLGEKND